MLSYCIIIFSMYLGIKRQASDVEYIQSLLVFFAYLQVLGVLAFVNTHYDGPSFLYNDLGLPWELLLLADTACGTRRVK
jgi:hypothetical protein